MPRLCFQVAYMNIVHGRSARPNAWIVVNTSLILTFRTMVSHVENDSKATPISCNADQRRPSESRNSKSRCIMNPSCNWLHATSPARTHFQPAPSRGEDEGTRLDSMGEQVEVLGH